MKSFWISFALFLLGLGSSHGYEPAAFQLNEFDGWIASHSVSQFPVDKLKTASESDILHWLDQNSACVQRIREMIGDESMLIGFRGDCDDRSLIIRTDGTRDLSTLLADDHDMDTADWRFHTLNDIFKDGSTNLQIGTDSSGENMAFLVQVPEPTGFWGIAIGLLGILLAMKKKKNGPPNGPSFP